MKHSVYMTTTAPFSSIDFVRRFNCASTTVVWLSAFTRGPHLGRVLRSTEMFHGYRTSSKITDFNWVLVRETTGLTGDGTYYGGVGNLSAEIECQSLIESVQKDDLNHGRRTVLMGSSMAAYAAAMFGIRLGIPVFCFSPHFDLRVARQLCGRGPWIDFCTSGLAPQARADYLQRLQNEVSRQRVVERPAQLLIQASTDDYGVFREQVIPFVSLARDAGHDIYADFRDDGGHSSVYINDDFLRHVIQQLSSVQPINTARLASYGRRHLNRYELIDKWLARVERVVAAPLSLFRMVRSKATRFRAY